MGDVGAYVATIEVTLADYQEFNAIIGVSVEVNISIDNGCLQTIFELASPMPTMIQFMGSSTQDPVVEPLEPTPDSKSLENGNSDGFTYCGGRFYTLRLTEIGRFISQDSTEVVESKDFSGNGPLTLYTSSMTLVLDG